MFTQMLYTLWAQPLKGQSHDLVGIRVLKIGRRMASFTMKTEGQREVKVDQERNMSLKVNRCVNLPSNRDVSTGLRLHNKDISVTIQRRLGHLGSQ